VTVTDKNLLFWRPHVLSACAGEYILEQAIV
jgi:hypothetical protein